MSTPPPPTGMPVRVSQILRVRKIWLLPVTIAAVFVALMAVIYFGSVVNPTGHMHSMPVMVVNQDTGATAHGQRVDVGASLVQALEGSSSVTSRLALHRATLAQAHERMDRGGAYATLVIPATLSRSVLVATGSGGDGARVPAKGSVELLENQRLGSLGVNLVAGVVTKAMAKISPQIGTKLRPLVTSSAAANPLMAAQVADPVALNTSTYRPLPDHSALGLSAFYVALLAIMAGFVAAPVLTGILLLVSAGLLGMYAPDPLLLWLLMAFASLMVAIGTLTLVAAVGSIGQLLAMILLVYLSLASSGGTVPIQALPGFFGVVGHVEPLRQVLLGTRAIMYFGARGDAGLTHSLILIGCELAFWALLGLAVTSYYDRKGLYRLTPDLFGSISRAIDGVVEERANA